ncbi:MAG TPA: NAD(P)H-dependent oxidoreductase [Solirubrobacteraceae bacterium]|nr:NAD(P)H-dependent oxidoreductase [Solirubrobacteraceae bacterium]
MDLVFRALADDTRRGLLDELFRRDGQTLTELEQRLPMTRFGVMKHLKVLEQAGLITTRRRGREKLHFLNPVPIRLIYDRWVSKYAEPWVTSLSGLKAGLEAGLEPPGRAVRDAPDAPDAPGDFYPGDPVITILLISGSSRDGSTNAAVLRTAAALAPDGVEAVLYAGIGELPLFNPDADREGAPIDERVAAMRAAVASADAVLVCTPEYAGALPAALKNLLEWTIGDAGTYAKPIAWINAAGPAAPSGAADAHDSLRRVLGYAGADIVESASLRAPVTREMVGPDGLVHDDAARGQIAAAVAALSGRVRAAAAESA